MDVDLHGPFHTAFPMLLLLLIRTVQFRFMNPPTLNINIRFQAEARLRGTNFPVVVTPSLSEINKNVHEIFDFRSVMFHLEIPPESEFTNTGRTVLTKWQIKAVLYEVGAVHYGNLG